MAKRKTSNSSSEKDQGKVRLLLVELEGNNESLQDSIRALTQAMNRPAVGPARQFSTRTNGDAAGIDDEIIDAELIDDEVIDETTEDDQQEKTRRRRGEGPKRDRNAGISLNPELNLKPEGVQCLEDFLAEKKPKQQQELIAAFVYWLTEIAAQASCDLDDLFTCFRKTGKKLPKDLRQSIRNSEKNQGWTSGELSSLTITTAGRNYIEHDLPGSD